MSTNFCGDHREDKIGLFHEKTLASFGIPQWMQISCPFCKRDLPLRSIRSVSAQFNARNLGDIVLEFYCIHCNKLDTLYFKSELENMSDFVEFINGSKSPKSTPCLEGEMYRLGYNNVVEKMIISGEPL